MSTSGAPSSSNAIFAQNMMATLLPACKPQFHFVLRKVVDFVVLQLQTDAEIPIAEYAASCSIDPAVFIAVQRRCLSHVDFDLLQFLV
ncbi:hypothetical protein SS50377_27120 [Spironucleus salmonicida]|uniref:Uncharacterized protein n=1 Tax=Spironucleus salmonicida TaxID=348837 RepID=V6LGW0_9EUKA|nr:hypothetical protein SS50377_27120 [Spironucleus salmonicida]|eukprot:EST43752.1 Hypothetical protein SS50377_16487 [Spironucleus salmonicida]